MHKFLLFILLACCFSGFSQNKKNIIVSGIVIDKNKNPISDVNIYIAKTSKGTKTNNIGRFFLPIGTFRRVTISHINYYTVIKKN